MNKRANTDVISIVIFLFAFGVVSIFSYLILHTMFSQTDAMNALMKDQTDPMILALPQTFLNSLQLFDTIIVILMAAMIIALGVINVQVATNRVYAWISFIIAPFLFFISYIFSYLFTMIASNTAFSGIIGYFSKTVLLCTNLHWIALISLCVSLIAMYGKRDSGQYLNFGGEQ